MEASEDLQELSCETRDLGIKWPQRHTLMFEGRETVDRRAICPAGVKENASDTSQKGLLEESGQPNTSVRSWMESSAGSNSSFAAKKN